MVRFNKNVPLGSEVSEVLVWNFVLEEVLPVNKNVFRRGDMVRFNKNVTLGSEVSEVLALNVVLEEALPVNKNFPLVDDMVAYGVEESCKSVVIFMEWRDG